MAAQTRVSSARLSSARFSLTPEFARSLFESKRPIFPNARKHGGVVLGHLGDGTRRAAAKPDCWHGHLCSIVEGVYLLDTTFDQVNVGRPDLRAEPLVIDLRRTKWFDPSPPWRGCPWTGCLEMFDAVVRYTKAEKQRGFKSAGDFQPSRRRRLVPELIALAIGIFPSLR
jgi:hypothetical protein